MKKKFCAAWLLCCLFCALLLPRPSAAADCPVWIASSADGDTVTVTLETDGTTAWAGITFLLTYDADALTLESAAPGRVCTDAKSAGVTLIDLANTNVAGFVKVAVATSGDPDGALKTPGTVYRFTFRAGASAQGGKITLALCDWVDENGNPLLSYVSGGAYYTLTLGATKAENDAAQTPVTDPDRVYEDADVTLDGITDTRRDEPTGVTAEIPRDDPVSQAGLNVRLLTDGEDSFAVASYWAEQNAAVCWSAYDVRFADGEQERQPAGE